MDAWFYKTRDQWQKKLDRVYGVGRFIFVSRFRLITGLWADVIVYEPAIQQQHRLRLFF